MLLMAPSSTPVLPAGAATASLLFFFEAMRARAGLSHEAAAELLGRLRAPDAGECPICMDAPQAPVMTACAHGPFCHECMLAVLQHQVRPPAAASPALIRHMRACQGQAPLAGTCAGCCNNSS